MKTHSSAVLMTEGPIWRRLVAFAIPLFLGNLFQQLYNTADSLIVGNFLGSNALAAVSSSGNLIFLMVGFFNGIAVGAGVVVAKYYGAKKYDAVQRVIHTIAALGILCGIALTFIGILAAPQILVLMGTPENVLPNSVVYFRVYFSGSLAFVMYNFLVGILQSVGDSRHPLIYLIISSMVNVVLDLLFVAVFHMGVGSAAFATVISQFISALLCLRQLMKSPAEYRLSLRKDPHRPGHAGTDYFQRSALRDPELHHLPGQRGGTVQHQQIRGDGHGRLRLLREDRRLRISSHHLFCHGADHLHQPEPGRQGI